MSEWTVDTLKEYSEKMLRALEEGIEALDRRVFDRFEGESKAIQAALQAAEKAVGKAEVNAEKWRENANEWRGSMLDRETRFMAREEALQMFKAVSDKIEGLTTRIDKAEGSGAGFAKSWAVALGAIGGIATLVALFYALSKSVNH